MSLKIDVVYSEMILLRQEKLWTLQMIGDKFGVSRERVRQIIGNTGNGYKSKRTRRIARSMLDKTNEEVAKIAGVSDSRISSYRSDIRHAVEPNSPIGVGVEWEEWAAETIEANGYSATLMPIHHPFDILVDNSVRVDVKYRNDSKLPPSQVNYVNPKWTFATKGKHNRYDILFCITYYKDVFVIPTNAIPEGRLDVSFCFPTTRPEIGKYQQYHNRYDLLAS